MEEEEEKEERIRKERGRRGEMARLEEGGGMRKMKTPCIVN